MFIDRQLIETPDMSRVETDEQAWKQTWHRFSALIAAWIVALIIVWTVAFVASTSMPTIIKNSDTINRSSPVDVLSAYDGQHYTHIATEGYSTVGEEVRRFAFFPLLPGLSRLFGGAEHAALAGILLSQLLFLGSLILLNLLSNSEGIVPLRRQAGFWLLVSPLSFFFMVFYTESLFLFLSLAMVIAYRKERFTLAFLTGILAGLTRPTAITLVMLCAYYAVHQWYGTERWRSATVSAIAPAVGVALYTATVGLMVGNPFGLYQIQREWWGQQLTLPFLSVLKDTRAVLLDLMRGNAPLADQLIRLVSVTSILALTAWGWHRLDRAWLAYLIVSMLFIHSREPHHSTARYELVLFPAFVLLAQSVVGRKLIAPVVAALLALVQLKFLMDFVSWRWVA